MNMRFARENIMHFYAFLCIKLFIFLIFSMYKKGRSDKLSLLPYKYYMIIELFDDNLFCFHCVS